MKQNVDTGTPVESVTDNKQKSGNGLKVATVIAFIMAVCGIGFGVYGMMNICDNSQPSEVTQESEISSDKPTNQSL